MQHRSAYSSTRENDVHSGKNGYGDEVDHYESWGSLSDVCETYDLQNYKIYLQASSAPSALQNNNDRSTTKICSFLPSSIPYNPEPLLLYCP